MEAEEGPNEQNGGGSGGTVTLPAPQSIMQGPGKTRAAKVKNKMPAAVQITAEQLLREARDRMEIEPPKPKRVIQDGEEAVEYRAGERQRFENLLRRNKQLISTWTKYARWEEQQGDYTRAVSVFERALDVESRNHSIWQRYAEMHMRAGNINMARNVYQRASTILPRVEVFWIKWTMMEQTAGDWAMARTVFDLWMQTQPQHKAWRMYIKFELRLGEVDHARDIVKRMVTMNNDKDSWFYYAKFEERHGRLALARRVWEEMLEALSNEHLDEAVWLGFAQFEERQREFERARALFKLALQRLPQNSTPAVLREYDRFEKQHGTAGEVERALHSKKRFEYEESLSQAPHLHDTWMNYVRLQESSAETLQAAQDVRELYERAVSQVPAVKEKHYWSRYIYLWIMWAFYEELDMGDGEAARRVWRRCLETIPHKLFSFSKVWIQYAQFELRHVGIDEARKVLGRAVGVHPRPKLFRYYIELETQLGNADRVRRLYENYVKARAQDSAVWTQFAEFEASLSEIDRARAIFELGVGQAVLDQPEGLWRRYILLEVREGEHARVRELYRRLCDRTRHVKVYLAWAQFESQTVKDVEAARAVYEEADGELSREKADGTGTAADELRALLTAWKDFESQHGTQAQQSHVEAKINPDQKRKRHQRLLERAREYKRQRREEGTESGTPPPQAKEDEEG